LQTQEPFWFDEAYKEPMDVSDTGALLRTLYLAEVASIIIFFQFDKSAKFLDFAGGYGLLTRRMRDIGFDFYWQDLYSPNLLARGFEYKEGGGDIGLITSFESFEHFADPLREIESMIELSKNILFTTQLLPDPVPPPDNWPYYGLGHGQHVSFYSLRTLQVIAYKYGLNFYSVPPVYMMTSKKIRPAFLEILVKLTRFGIFLYIRKAMRSRTVKDCNMLSVGDYRKGKRG
jgi:hypothetical protein